MSHFNLWLRLRLSCMLVWLLLEAGAVFGATRVTVQDTAGQPLSVYEARWVYNHKAHRLQPADGAVEIPERAGVVAIRAAAYQSAGLAIDGSSADELVIIMRREDEPAGRDYRTRAQGIDPELRQQLLELIEEKCWASLKQAVNPTETAFTLQLLGQLAPRPTLQYLQDNQVDQNAAGMARQAAIRTLARQDIAAAAEVLDAVKNPMFRSFLLGQLIEALPPGHSSLPVVESQWTDTIREIDQPAMRLASWAMLGEHYVASGQLAKASQIAQQQMPEVQKLPAGGWSGFPRSLFAALIVNDDADLAAELLKGIDENGEARALGRLAFHAGKKNPQAALTFLKRIDKGNLIGFPYTTRVAYHIVLDQPEAAFEIADLIEPGKHRAWALGLMSERLASTDAERSRTAFTQAWAELDQAAQAKLRTYVSPGEVAAGLLPVAERVRPEQLESLIWQTVSATIPRTRWKDGAEAFSVQLENVAAAVSRYDERIAHGLVSGPQPTAGAKVAAEHELTPRAVLNRLALDAASLPQLLENHEVSSRNYRVFETLIKAIAEDTEGFWTMVSIPNLMPWPTERFEES